MKSDGLTSADFGDHKKGKDKAFPLQAWAGPWGSWRLRLQNFYIVGI